jgi:hypothetical protein
MNRLSATLLFLILQVFIVMPGPVLAATALQPDGGQPQPTWKSSSAQHVYGLPGTKPKEKGTLALTPDGLTFTGKFNSSSIERRSVIAVSAGNQRVELWGIKGRLLRMAIPDGGGLAAASVMHHRVDMLTVEFSDKGGYHGVVFFLPANEAEHALQSFAEIPVVHREAVNAACQATSVEPGSVLVSAPAWDQIQVPAAYRALVYERLINRLQHVKGIGHVYRDGENDGQLGCPQYAVHISIAGFKQGSQVKRAVMGPVGMFVGTTQMTFDVTFTDASGRLNTHQQVKATVRGESESMNVIDKISQQVVKKWAKEQEQMRKGTS